MVTCVYICDLLLEGDRVPPQVRPLPLDGHRTVQDWERVGSACGLIYVYVDSLMSRELRRAWYVYA